MIIVPSNTSAATRKKVTLIDWSGGGFPAAPSTGTLWVGVNTYWSASPPYNASQINASGWTTICSNGYNMAYLNIGYTTTAPGSLPAWLSYGGYYQVFAFGNADLTNPIGNSIISNVSNGQYVLPALPAQVDQTGSSMIFKAASYGSSSWGWDFTGYTRRNGDGWWSSFTKNSSIGPDSIGYNTPGYTYTYSYPSVAFEILGGF